MKRKIGTLMEESIMRMAKRKAVDEGRALSDLIQDALEQYLRKDGATLKERKMAFHMFCERPMKIPAKQLRYVLDHVSEPESRIEASGFSLHRARLIWSGFTWQRQLRFRINAELGGSAVGLRDGFFEYQRSPALWLRGGQFKVPLARQNLVSKESMLFADRALAMDTGWMGDRWPGFPNVQVRTESSLGGSALFGVRYSRYVKGRLAVEADFAVAPTHDLDAGGELCLNGNCFGSAESGRMRGPWGMGPGQGDVDLDGFRSRNVTAWHYGGGITYDITGGEVRPIVIFGAGGVSYDGARESSTDFALRFGAGLKVYFGKVGGRVDVVDHLVTDHFLTGDEHDIHVTTGFLVRF